MSSSNRRAALGALESATPQARRLGRSSDPEENAADIIELWSATETALRSMLGGAPFSGRELISEVRRRELIGIATAHALVDFLTTRERVERPNYAPGRGDVDVSRGAYESLVTTLRQDVSVELPPAPAESAPAYVTAPAAAPDAPPEPPARRRIRLPGSIRRMHLLIAGAAVLVLAIIVAAVVIFTRPRAAPPELAQGAAAYQAGRTNEAMQLFARAALREPDRAVTFLWMARIHRERGEFPAAVRNLERAATLAPNSADVHRELGSYFFARGNYEAARQRYVRTIELDPQDRAAQGYLACSLYRLGRAAEAQPWFQRAGQGPWVACLRPAPMMAPQ